METLKKNKGEKWIAGRFNVGNSTEYNGTKDGQRRKLNLSILLL